MNDVIKQYLSAGLSIIPVKADKRPVGEWKHYQSTLAGFEADLWDLPIACVCGEVSGGLTCIDFDNGGSAFADWGRRVKDIAPAILDRVYMQKTPSGGWHVVFRSDMKLENKKLAQKKDDAKVTVLIETRGEGGYFLVAPSNGYTPKHGDITKLEKISVHEADSLIRISESFNEMPKEKAVNIPRTTSGLTPFDDYDMKHDPIDLLVRHGWSVIGNRSEKVLLCRPGKQGSLSATWNHIPNRLYVFSTSTEFEAQNLYKPSAVYAVLEHRGDYVAAAKQLYKDGYGDRVESKVEVDYDTTPKTTTVKISTYRESIYTYYKSSKEKGVNIGLNRFDSLLRFDRGYLNVVTGIPTHGKSEFLDFVMVLLAKKHNWNFVVFSPENYPLEIHFNKLAEKFMGCSLFGKGNEFIEESIDFIDDHFDFINATEEDLTLETILSACLDVKAKGKVDALVIDPWNEIEQAIKPSGMNDSDFTGVCLRRLRKFARKNNICLFIAVHPTKMQKNRDTEIYPVPTLYDISGSSNWYNKADNGITIYRNFDPENESTDVYVKKVKYRNYGQLGMVRFEYKKDSGNYVEKAESEFFDNVK